MSIYRLIYVSKPKVKIEPSILMNIYGDSEKHNKEMEITGLLLSTDTHFIQVIEGEKNTLNRLYNSIVQDERHEILELVSYKQVPVRVFSNWTMKIVRLKDQYKGLNEMIIERYGQGKSDFSLPQDPDEMFALLHDVYLFLKLNKV